MYSFNRSGNRKFGMKHVVLASAVIFGISSVLCGMSTSLNEMIFFRLVHGLAVLSCHQLLNPIFRVVSHPKSNLK